MGFRTFCGILWGLQESWADLAIYSASPRILVSFGDMLLNLMRFCDFWPCLVYFTAFPCDLVERGGDLGGGRNHYVHNVCVVLAIPGVGWNPVDVAEFCGFYKEF